MTRRARPNKLIQWHRLFGIALMDYFHGSRYKVEVEVDLSLKQQLLDVVVIERKGKGKEIREILDGLENLRPHNLITYKSIRESLTAWSLQELVGHYVNYRKLHGEDKVQAEEVGLYAVCTRSPKEVSRCLGLQRVRQGVYDGALAGLALRVIVLGEVPEASRNAFWAIFSGRAPKVQYGVEHYQWHVRDWTGVLRNLWQYYRLEGIGMPYTLKQFRRDFVLEHLDELKPEERLKGLKPRERLQGLKPEERLQGLRPEEILSKLDPGTIRSYLSRQGRGSSSGVRPRGRVRRKTGSR